MQRYFALAFTLVLTAQCGGLRAEAADAYTHEFPGTGNREAWDQANTYYAQGVTATHNNKVVESIEMYKKAIAIYPEDPDFQINLGVALEDKGSYKEAEAVLNHALTLAPQNWTVPYNLGNVFYSEHKYQDAVNAWTKCMALSPPQHFKEKSASNIAAVTKQYLSKGHK
jgi:tetratricopeptide (TPR) repeat protein